MISPRLVEGIALLLHGDEWVDAITDERARTSAVFTHWHDGFPAKPVILTSPESKKRVEWARIAHFVDADGRKWIQRSFGRRGTMEDHMIVKVELHAGRVVTISNEDGSMNMAVTLSSPLLARMRGAQVCYFQADVSPFAIELGDVTEGW